MDIRKYCARFSSWFCIPEQGMKEYEILSRGTCFYISKRLKEKEKADTTYQTNRLFLTCAHIVAPWKWPNYYPEEWLQFVNESHVKYTMDFHKPEIGTTRIVFDNVELHPTRDLAILSVDGNDELTSTLASICKTHDQPFLDPVTLMKDKEAINSKVSVMGYEVKDLESLDNSDLQDLPQLNDDQINGKEMEDNRLQVPFMTEGLLKCRIGSQTFVEPRHPVNDGVCGGPVVNTEGKCIGMIEGSVPITSKQQNVNCPPSNLLQKQVEGNAAVIDADVISAFVKDVYG
mmetsp:Transcript_28560/g.37391  ORF Transcript_28560/g.37391 Transcript_28560/m.37391 type:complete len:288 (+) Transcript_28560:301-1164(+)